MIEHVVASFLQRIVDIENTHNGILVLACISQSGIVWINR